MRTINRRVHRLEERLRPAVERRLTVQLGYLKELPADYTGPRHVVTVKQTESDSHGVWFEWEERPGPEPQPAAGGANNEHVLRLGFVGAKDGRPAS